MKRVFLLLLCIITVPFFITSCTKDAVNDQSQLLTGVFTKEEVVFNDSFKKSSSAVLEGNKLYFIGNTASDDGLKSSVLAVLNTEDMNISYETLPKGEYSGLAVSVGRYLLLETSFNEQTFRNEHTLHEVSGETTVWTKSVSEIMTLPDNYWGRIYIASADGRWYIGAGTSFALLTSDGAVEKTELLPSEISGLQKDTDGKLHIRGREFHKIIDKNGSLRDTESLKTGVGNLYFTKGYDYCYANENGLYGYSAETGSDTEIMNWTNSGIVYSRGVRELEVVSTELIYIYGSDGIGGKTGLWRCTKSNDVELDGIEVIRVTYMEDGKNQVPLAAVKYNAAQTQYRIILNEFSSSISDGDLMWSFDKAILGGSIGDIVVTQDFDSLRKYGEKGVFTDLYSLMNNDMSADDFFGCVRQACEINGKLYGIPREFRLETYATKNNIDAQAWNMDLFIQYANSLKDGSRALLYMTQNDVYSALRDSVISECIDLDNHTCSFDSYTFREFLAYIASLPRENTEELNWNENYYIDGRVAFFASEINSYAGYYQMKNVFGDEANTKIVGYPSLKGGAAKLKSESFYSIIETSKVKDEAIAFIRYLLSADCVIDEVRGMRSIPSLKTTAKAWDESEGQLYYFFYYDNIGRWSADTKPISSKDEGVPGVCIQLTQERIDEVYDFLDNARVYPYIPSTVAAIVDEDMSAFMNTAKTAEETVKVIQSRVNTYLSEKE